MTALVVRGDALHLPLRDNSVDLIVTSPPYFALRAYQTGHEMEVGSEPSPQAYLEALWAATREMKRVLKPTGSIWINLGDKYASAMGTPHHGKLNNRAAYMAERQQALTRPDPAFGVPNKSLLGLPWRYAIGCIDQLGLILRRDLIWDKPNGLPESVTDRPRSSHEYWFMFVKQPRYFAALDELREPHAYPHDTGRTFRNADNGKQDGRRGPEDPGGRTGYFGGGQRDRMLNPLGKLPGSVWSIPSEPLRLPPWIDTAHYAAFPSEWPRRLILGFTPHLICGVCGVGRFPVVDRRNIPLRSGDQAGRAALNGEGIHGPDRRAGTHVKAEATIVGYGCACTPFTDHPGTGERDHSQKRRGSGKLGWHQDNGNPMPKVGPWREYHLDRWTPPPGHPATVLDPFGGTGCTMHVARALGRHAISIDLSEAYCRLAADQGLGSLARQRAAKVHGRVHAERQGSLL